MPSPVYWNHWGGIELVGPNATTEPMKWTIYSEGLFDNKLCNKVAQKSADDSATSMVKQMNSNPNKTGHYSTEVVSSSDKYHFKMWHTDGGNKTTPMFIMWHVCLPNGEKPDLTKLRPE